MNENSSMQTSRESHSLLGGSVKLIIECLLLQFLGLQLDEPTVIRSSSYD